MGFSHEIGVWEVGTLRLRLIVLCQERQPFWLRSQGSFHSDVQEGAGWERKFYKVLESQRNETLEIFKTLPHCERPPPSAVCRTHIINTLRMEAFSWSCYGDGVQGSGSVIVPNLWNKQEHRGWSSFLYPDIDSQFSHDALTLFVPPLHCLLT